MIYYSDELCRIFFAVVTHCCLLNLMQLQDLATTMLELWNLMDTPIEEQQEYQHITCNIAASEHEITEANSLSEDFIKYVSCGDFSCLHCSIHDHAYNLWFIT